MKKIIVFIMICFMFVVTPAFAKEVTANLQSCDVVFNGEKIESGNRQFPLLVYKDITYVPMTYYDCRYLGLISNWDSETSTLSIEKGDITCAYRDYNWEWENANRNLATICDCNIVVNGKKIDNSQEEYPLITFRDVTYFPLTWRFAVDEFGWEYSFDVENGLVINSDNYHVKTLDLPYCTGMVATDGVYYYYNGKSEDKNVIYRVAVDDTSKPEIIHEVPKSDLSQTASLQMVNGEVYINYSVGSGPTMSTEYYYKIEGDGSLTRQNPGNYSGGKHGYSEVTKEENGIFVKGVNEFFDSPTKITYTIDGVETEVEALPGRVQIGRKRDGKQDYSANGKHEYIQIFGNKIYYTGIDLDAGSDSALYCIDTATGKTEKMIDGVWGFYVYTGWLNEENSDSTMIIYDSNGQLMRYEELTGKTRVVDESIEEDTVLVAAVGGNCIYTVQKTLAGDRTIVKAYSDYANGYGSINGDMLFETKTGTYVGVKEDKIIINVSGEAVEDSVRLLVIDGEKYMTEQFCSADVASGLFVYNDTLLYCIGDNSFVKVEL